MPSDIDFIMQLMGNSPGAKRRGKKAKILTFSVGPNHIQMLQVIIRVRHYLGVSGKYLDLTHLVDYTITSDILLDWKGSKSWISFQGLCF